MKFPNLHTVFEIYIEWILAPSLQTGQIVILDNLSTHTGEKVRQAIEARGCQLLFLPSYSPDLSPIEEAFSKLKAFLRRVEAHTPETLQEAPGQALLTITAQDASSMVYALWVLSRHSSVFPRGRSLEGRKLPGEICSSS
jgi:transposase